MCPARSPHGGSPPCPKPLAWVTGAGGLIGSHIVRAAASHAPEWEVYPLTRTELDLTDAAGVHSLFRRTRPQLIVHCAALSQTRRCEQEPALAHRLNVDVTHALARLAAGIPLVFFSSDLVFDGRHGHYREEAQPNPLTVYAATKLEAERAVLANPRHTVIRTSLNAGISPSRNHAFNEELHRAFRERRVLRLFTDEYRSPIAAQVTACAVWDLVRADRPGLYHVAGSQRLSRWEIGQLLAERWKHLNPRIEPISLRDYTGPPRSPDTSLDCAKISPLLSFPLPRFSDWLRENPDGLG